MSASLKIALALGVVVAWTVGVWGPGDHWAATTPRSTERANVRLQAGDPAAARALLDAATRPRQPGLDTLLVQGFAALALDDHAAAAEALDQALRVDGADPQAWLGQCLLSTATAVPYDAPCDHAISFGEIDPGCGAPLARATARIGAGDLKGARDDLARCRAIDPNETALSRLEAAVTAEEELRDARLRAEAAKAERLAEARRRAAERMAREREAREEAAEARADAQARDRAERERAELDRVVAEELAAMEEENPTVPAEEEASLSLSARAALELGSLTRRAIALRNDRAKRKLRRRIGDIRETLDEERPLAAIEELDELAEGRAPGLEEKLLRAEALRQAERPADAIAGLEAIAIHLEDAGPLTVDGCVLASDLERGALSETLCGRIDDRFTDRARGIAANALGLARWAAGDYPKAEIAFANALALDPEDELFWSDAALSAATLGAVDLSLERMRRAMALDPESIDVDMLATEPQFAEWRRDPRAQAAIEALQRGEIP